MEKKFTKGEWKVSDLGTVHASENRVYVHGNKEIAVVSDYKMEHKRFDEAKANATIIAAAPELLEALEGLLRDFKEVIGENDLEPPCAGYIGVAEDVIKKATE